ncbi:MAG: hypothetical protein GY804_08795 [Alphaproteobacteria bacterium]|nr:hypothetical protein [Alphaproteobacteria bacterium]
MTITTRHIQTLINEKRIVENIATNISRNGLSKTTARTLKKIGYDNILKDISLQTYINGDCTEKEIKDEMIAGISMVLKKIKSTIKNLLKKLKKENDFAYMDNVIKHIDSIQNKLTTIDWDVLNKETIQHVFHPRDIIKLTDVLLQVDPQELRKLLIHDKKPTKKLTPKFNKVAGKLGIVYDNNLEEIEELKFKTKFKSMYKSQVKDLNLEETANDLCLIVKDSYPKVRTILFQLNELYEEAALYKLEIEEVHAKDPKKYKHLFRDDEVISWEFISMTMYGNVVQCMDELFHNLLKYVNLLHKYEK